MVSKLRLVFSISILFLSFYGSAQRDYWKQEAAGNDLKGHIFKKYKVQKGEVFSFEEGLFRKELGDTKKSKSGYMTVGFPNEKGKIVLFAVTETPVFSKELSEKYPSIKSYSGYSLKNNKERLRFSVSHRGIQGMIVHSGNKGNTYLQKAGENRYIVYNRDDDDFVSKEFICTTKGSVIQELSGLAAKPVDDQVLRKFRIGWFGPDNNKLFRP